MNQTKTITLAIFWLTLIAVAQQPLTLNAADGIKVYGDSYPASGTVRGTLLLFHQVEGNRGEYSSSIPLFTEAGFNVLAIDQRVGGNSFERENQTKKALLASKIPQRLEALADLEAALAWAKAQKAKNIIVVGSSYSAALVLVLAAKYPADIAAVMAFSPGEYLNQSNPNFVREAASKIKVPTFIASIRSELSDAEPLYKAISGSKTLYIPEGFGIHGAAALRNPLTREKYWKATQAFLAQFK